MVQPLNKQYETISEIADFLIFYAHRYTNPGSALLPDHGDRIADLKEAGIRARTLASAIIVRTQAIPFYNVFVRLNLAQKTSSIQTASQGLFFISNNLREVGGSIDNYKMSQKVADALGIYKDFRQPNADA